MLKKIANLSVSAAVALLAASAVHAADSALHPGNAASGKVLHNANCVACHDSGVYTRKNRRITTIEGLIGQVNGCNKQLSTNFTRDQVNDIVSYLNETYYKFK